MIIRFVLCLTFFLLNQLRLVQAQTNTPFLAQSPGKQTGTISQTITVNLRVMARLPQELFESSGVIASHPNKIWSHEDSGNLPELYCVDTTGQLLRTLIISNAQNIDWEDIATDAAGNIYICDAGNNDNNRKNLAIYRIPNPENISGNSIAAEIIRFVLSDQTQFPPPVTNRNFDIEGLVWHNDTLFLFSKNRTTPFNGYCKMYKLPAQTGNMIAQLVDSVYLGSTIETARVTAADIHRQTGQIMLLTARKLVSFRNYSGSRFFSGDRIEYIFSTFPGQNEGITFIAPNRLYMSEEGSGSLAGFLYEIVLPATGISTTSESDPVFEVFPNPTDNQLTINSLWPAASRLSIFDAHGNRLHNALLGENRSFDLSPYPAGIYFFVLEYRQQKISRRVIKL